MTGTLVMRLKVCHQAIYSEVLILNCPRLPGRTARIKLDQVPAFIGMRRPEWVMSGRRSHCKKNLAFCLRSGASHVSGLFARCHDRWP